MIIDGANRLNIVLQELIEKLNLKIEKHLIQFQVRCVNDTDTLFW